MLIGGGLYHRLTTEQGLAYEDESIFRVTDLTYRVSMQSTGPQAPLLGSKGEAVEDTVVVEGKDPTTRRGDRRCEARRRGEDRVNVWRRCVQHV